MSGSGLMVGFGLTVVVAVVTVLATGRGAEGVLPCTPATAGLPAATSGTNIGRFWASAAWTWKSHSDPGS